MPNILRVKRRASGGAAGAPSSLANAELAYNEQDTTLYIGEGTGGTNGSATSIRAIAGPGAFTTLGTTQTVTGDKTFSGAVNFTGNVTGLPGGGTVTSVALSLPDIFTVTGSPISSTGTLTGALATQSPNFVFAGPATGSTAVAPTFRALVSADIPTLNQNTTGTAGNVTGTVAFANGGTGQTTQQAALNALAGAVTSGQYLRGNGTNVSMGTIQVGDLPAGTGTGSLVYATSPSLTAPTLGVATATSINKLAITAPATSATLTIADGKTLTANNTLTFTGTDSSSVAFSTGGTVAYTANKLNAFAATTSTELAGVLTDKTGTGSFVLSVSPALTGTVSADNLTVAGDLTVNGTTTTINSTTVTIDDKNFTLGDVASPTDAGADGGGITLKGTTDKTFNWVNATTAWTSSEHLNLVSTKEYRINGTSVLSSNTLGSGVTASSLTSVGTIATGTWNGTAIGVAYGGINLTSAPQGSVLVANTANTYTALDGGGSTDKLLLYNASTDTISWASEIDGGTF